MKVIRLLTVFVLVLLCSILSAQRPVGVDPVTVPISPTTYNGCIGCQHGTATDPVHPSPIFFSLDSRTNPQNPPPPPVWIPDFRTNSFDWSMNRWQGSPNIPLLPARGIPVIGKSGGDRVVNNPFGVAWADYTKFIVDDYTACDGWELIKQDFGSVYENGRWDGNQRRVTDPANSSIGFMMLYNKYRSILRIVGASTQEGATPFQQVLVQLKLINSKDNDNVLNVTTDYNSNAMFSIYENTRSALDQNSKVQFAKSPAFLPDRFGCFFADFNVAYDPCICFFQSGLEVSFEFISKSEMILSGRLLGTAVDVTKFSSGIDADYLNSVTKDNAGFQSYNQSYKDILKLQNTYNAPQAAASTPFNIPTIMSGLSGTKSLSDAIQATGYYKDWILEQQAEAARLHNQNITPSDVLKSISSTLGAVSGAFNFINIGMNLLSPSNPKPSPARPMVIKGDISLSGELTTTNRLVNGKTIIGVPGSKEACNLPEYPKTILVGRNNKAVPMYPMYNEQMGNFALLKTPNLDFSRSLEDIDNGGVVGTRTTCQFKISDNIDNFKYSWGALVNPNSRYIMAHLVFRGFYPTNNIAINAYKDPIDNTIFRTEDVPLESLHNQIVQIVGEQYPSRGEGPPFASNASVEIVLQLFYDFVPSVHGNTLTGQDEVCKHANMEEVHYKVKVSENNNIDYREDPRFLKFVQDPTPIIAMKPAAVEAYCKGKDALKYNANIPAPLIKKSDPANNSANQPKSKKKSVDFLGLNIFPNPFKSEFELSYTLSSLTNISIVITNTLGQQVKLIEEGQKDKGVYTLNIDTKDLVSGAYFVTVKTNEGIQTLKVVKQ
jgi:hypothetical protein